MSIKELHKTFKNRTQMKAMTKKQLAACAGISVKTLTKWLAPHKAELARMGYPVGRRCIPPSVVGWIAEKFCIDLDNPSA